MTVEEKASKSKKTGSTGSNGMLLAVVGCRYISFDGNTVFGILRRVR